MRASPSRDAGRRAGKSGWHLLLVVLILAPLVTPLYNKVEPRLLGFPFFYWSQLALIFVVTAGTAAVHLLSKRGR
jgi:Protein of unknown function (DUF3311)